MLPSPGGGITWNLVGSSAWEFRTLPLLPVLLRQSRAHQQRPGVGVAAHEAAIEFGRVFAVALRQNFAAERGADLAAEDAAIAEAGEGIGIQHLRPLMGVIAGAVTHRGREQ